MFWAWQTVAHVILLQVAIAFYVLVWPALRKGAFLASRKFSNWFPGDDAEAESASAKKQTYRGKWRDAQFRNANHRNDSTHHQKSPPKQPHRPPQKHKYLTVLGLKEPVHLIEIKSAYRRMAKLYHPDRFASERHSDADRRAAAAKMRDVNAAYDWLRANA